MKGPILLVEDNYDTMEVYLRKLKNYFVIEFEKGNDAIQFINEGNDYKLAVVDLSLPGPVSGEEVIRISRKVNPDAYVISVSGYLLETRKRLDSDEHIVKGIINDNRLFEYVDSFFRKKGKK